MITTLRAYAKINIALNILGRKENGYHDVDMITIPLELHDILEMEPLPEGYETYITSDDYSLPTDESNLSNKGFMIMRNKFDLKKNFRIHIYKRIPMCAGLGGGSADAAAVMNGCLKLSKLKEDASDLIEVGKSIGGDVPFCLFNKPARCKGIGEDLEFIQIKNKYYVLLIKPREGISTAQAYNDYDLLAEKPQQSNIDRMIQALADGDDDIVAEEMKNALQEPAIALVPEIKNIIDQLKGDGFPMTMMSGSGSTVFAMSRDSRALNKEAKKFSEDKYSIVLTSVLR